MIDGKVVIFDDGQMIILVPENDPFNVEFRRKDLSEPYVKPEGFDGDLVPYYIENRIINSMSVDTNFEQNTENAIPVKLILRNCQIDEQVVEMLEKIPEIYGVNLLFEGTTVYKSEEIG